MKKYVTTSLETHLFFGRIMKEHSFFLQAAFPAGETGYRNKADWFRKQFESMLAQTVVLSDGMVCADVLQSKEIFTEFTENAEKQTMRLAKIPIDIRITQAEKRLRAGCTMSPNKRMVQKVRQLNRNILRLLDGLIAFKEKILRDVLSCNLYTANYPLLIEHILREAKLYRQTIAELEEKGLILPQEQMAIEQFWNRIMMEHALFIRGLLDPTEDELINTADNFAKDYCRLLEEAKRQEMRTMGEVTNKTLVLTEQYRDFKAAGTKGITECEIRSIILPLLADHVLREANHYIRILKKNGVERI